MITKQVQKYIEATIETSTLKNYVNYNFILTFFFQVYDLRGQQPANNTMIKILKQIPIKVNKKDINTH